jgi:hypothetical protein
MSAVSPRGGNFVAETSNTVGTGIAFNLLGAISNGAFKYRTVSQAYSNGDVVYYVRSQAVSSSVLALFEAGIGTYSTSTNKITPVTVLDSSTTPPGTTPTSISWTGGVSQVWCVPSAEEALTQTSLIRALATVFGSSTGVLSSPFHTAAFIDTGIITGTLPLLVSGGLPAVGGVNLTSLPTHTHSSIVVSGLAGGATSRICRSTGSTTVTEAHAINASGHVSDTADQLRWLVAKGSDSTYYRFGVVPFTGVVANNHYFLGVNGGVITTRVTVDGTNSCVYVGYCRTNDVLDVNFNLVVTERLSTGVGLVLDNGNIAVP